jgi:hypothetical protein
VRYPLAVVAPSNPTIHCEALTTGVNKLQNSLRARSLENIALLEQFWDIQDNLHRLLASCDDEPSAAFAALARHKGMITSVLDVLKAAPRTNDAILETCKNINDLLRRVDFFRQKFLTEKSATHH